MKHITLIGAVLLLAMLAIVPASAVWHNGNWLTDEEYQKVVGDTTVVTDPATGVDSKYKDTNPAIALKNSGDYASCRLEGTIRCGYNTLTSEVILSNVINPNATTSIPVLPDGTFSFEGLAAGKYTLMLKDGNGGQPEYSTVTCVAGAGVVRPESELLGHAVAGEPSQKCDITVIRASYGAFEERCGEYYLQYRVRGHWDTHERCVCDHRNWRGQCTEGHIETVYEWDHSNSWSSWSTSEPSRYSEIPCYDKQSRSSQDCETVGGYTDVTSNVQAALATDRTSFVFDNSKNPGGIFDITSTVLLSTIEDPAPGIVKHVSIEYSDCSGIQKHISGEEYQTISL